MVGRSTLNECLKSDNVSEVLIVNRRQLDVTHPKLKELIHKDFLDFSQVAENFEGYDACFHCMGVSSVGKNEEEFTKFTFDITKSLADACHQANPQMVMNYVSGVNTDSTEEGNTMWARVKGRTENYILHKGFKDAYMFRLGALVPEGEVSFGTSWYKYVYIVMSPFFPLMKKLKSVATSSSFGKAMINTVLFPSDLKYLENKEINHLASKS